MDVGPQDGYVHGFRSVANRNLKLTSFESVTLTVSPVSLIKKLLDLSLLALLLVFGFGAFVGSTLVLRFDSKPAKQIRNLSSQRIKHVFLRFLDKFYQY